MNWKKSTLLPAIVCILIQGCVHSDTVVVIEGIVTAAGTKPIVNATIDILGYETYSNSDGYFCFVGLLPRRDIPISISKTGFKPLHSSLEYAMYSLEIELHTLGSAPASKLERNVLPKGVGSITYCRDRH